MLSAKPKDKDLEAYRDITDDVEESDFVPYACLCNPHTILTKNGELLQTIKMVGFSYEALSSAPVGLREVIRQALLEHVREPRYAIWFHTMRRKQSLAPEGQFSEPFATQVDQAWNQKNDWNNKFINELYVSIVREGENVAINDAKKFGEGLLPKKHLNARNRYLDDAANELDRVVSGMMDTLQDYGARRLEIVERDGVFHSEQLEFLEKLINLEERPMPVPDQDLSYYLTSGEITFGFDAMEVRTAEGKRRFAAILTIKEYKEASLPAIDEFLQIPCEYIISQCFDYVNASKALAQYQEQERFLRIGGDSEFAQSTELNRIMQSNRQQPVDYGEQQTTIFLICDSVNEVEKNVRMVRRALSNIGIVSIREDLKFEECYWAQLPANFEFVSRLSAIDTAHVAGFVNLNNYPAGNASGDLWGPPTSLFRTAAGTPYFYNLHIGDNAHTAIIGPRGSGKTVLTNFIAAQARKYQPRLWYVDALRGAGQLINTLGGTYVQPGNPRGGIGFNPLLMEDNNPNREFLTLWLIMLIDPHGANVNDATIQGFKGIIDQIYKLPPEHRNLQSIGQALGAQNPALAEKFSQWYGSGKYANLFTAPEDALTLETDTLGIDVSAYINDVNAIVPLASYILHRMTNQLDGRKSMLVLDEAWRLLDNPIFGPRVQHWLEYLRTQNTACFLTTEDVDDAGQRQISKAIMPQLATQIYLPHPYPDSAYINVFGLTEEEFGYLSMMNAEERHFLLKRGNETIVAELDLGGLDDIIGVLSGQSSDTVMDDGMPPLPTMGGATG